MAKEEIRDAVYTRRYIYNFHYHLIWVTKYRNKAWSSPKCWCKLNSANLSFHKLKHTGFF